MNKRMLTITILCVSLLQMGMVALAPVVSAVTTAFPGTSALTAQLATTFLNLVLVIVALFSGTISKFLSRRVMTALGMLLTAVTGLLAPFCTLRLWMVFLWSGLLGAGVGLFVPVASSLMIDCFEDDERQRVVGWQTACVNLGGMGLSLVSGLLASGSWSRAYLVFLLAIPVLFLCIKYVPGQKSAPRADAPSAPKAKIPGSVWLACLQTAVFAVLYFAFSTNVSLFLVERGLTDTSLAGVATACFMFGGCVCGLFFTRVFQIIGRFTAAGAFLLLAISYFALYALDGLVPVLIAAFLGGGSLSFIFPFFLVTVADQVDPSVSIISSSLIVSVGPNFGSFISPMILTNLTAVFYGDAVAPRFLVTGLLAAVLGLALALIAGRRNPT